MNCPSAHACSTPYSIPLGASHGRGEHSKREGVSAPREQFNVVTVGKKPLSQLAVQIPPDWIVAPSTHGAAVAFWMSGTEHGSGKHEKLLGVSSPSAHVSSAGEGKYPSGHLVWQTSPDLIKAPSWQAESCGAGHELGSQEKFWGLRTPKLQFSTALDGV
mmetsp:Transcript_120977/g.209085  ORF Transcript_120977/g.209085 Transcript_120977/m.209085 type:complete len:160 (-) Transcript_120977:82-561(-)